MGKDPNDYLLEHYLHQEPTYHALAAEYAKERTGTQAPEGDAEKARQALTAYIIIKKSNNKWLGDLKKELQGNQLWDVGNTLRR